MLAVLGNLSVKRRFAFGVAAILALSMVAIAVSIVRLHGVAAATRQMIDEPMATERYLQDWYRNMMMAVPRATAIIVSTDPGLADFFAATSKVSAAASNALQKQVEAHMDAVIEQKLFAELGARRKDFLGTRDQLMALKKAGRDDEAQQQMRDVYAPKSEAYLASAAALLAEQRCQIDAAGQRIEQINVASRDLMSCLGATLAFALGRSVGKPLERAVALARRIAAGDRPRAWSARHATQPGSCSRHWGR